MSPADHANIAQHLPAMAARQPVTPALLIPRGLREGRIDYLSLSFAELSTEAAAWQARFTATGIQPGDRTLVMVRPGLPLIAAVFGLFGIGAVPVVIDPGMGLKSFLACVRRSQPRALVGIPLARFLSHVARSAFSSVKIRVAASGSTTSRLPARPDASFSVRPSGPNDLAAILFTSGSTGAPKGVCYTHGMFAAQVRLIRDTYDIQPGERDLPMLPIFALFNPALGMTTVVPELDPARPASVDPERIIRAIQQENITNSFGSPTLWAKIARHAEAHRITLPSMRRVLCAGAPVPPGLWAAMGRILPNGELHSPYGATEALPVSSIRASEVLSETAAASLAGDGACVGTVIPGNEARVIALTDEPLATLGDARELPVGEIGEIIVRGPTVTREYDALPEATAAAKLRGPDGSIWHRMGDTGYLDAKGRLWFCGRKVERLETTAGPLFTEQVEPAFTAHPQVRRAALVGLGKRGQQIPAIVIQPTDAAILRDIARRDILVRELAGLVASHPHASRVQRLFVHPDFPVDVRHNAKIHRLTLARWAATAEGSAFSPASS